MRPVRVLWSHDPGAQTRGYWAIGVALHRAGCEVVLGGPQSPAEVAEAATQEQVDVVGYRAMGEDAAARVRELQAALSELGSPSPPLAVAGLFETEDAEALRAAGVREVFEILTPIETIAERMQALGSEFARAQDR